LDAIKGLRGPPTELLVQGGSNYRSDMLRTQRPAAGKSIRPVEPNTDAVAAVLAQAEARLAECPTGPVHVYDLHETAMRIQKEIVDKENMVRVFSDKLTRQVCPLPHCPFIHTRHTTTSQVLRFKSFFMESVPNSRLEKERARIMTLSFHVSDNTLRVYEPPQESSGLYQVRVCERVVNSPIPTFNLPVPNAPPLILLQHTPLTLPSPYPPLPRPCSAFRESLQSATCP